MPDVPIIDSHVHLWDPQRFRMPWLAELDRIKRRFALDEYTTATAAHTVEALVVVEAGVDPAQALDEAQWLAALARQEPRLRGIVAAASLEHGAQVRAHLEALV
ncbi:MAG: amidohydrolase, partial [Chloroflexi bacterium]|nr:amidohydrolase [Chloroflexota bacterium]